MIATTPKKGRPTINKENKTEVYYSFRKSTNEAGFNKKAKKRRVHEKFKALKRKENR